MTKIAILVTERCQASNIHIILDILIAANQVAVAFLGSRDTPIKFELIGTSSSVKAYNESSIDNIRPMQKTGRPDIVILPGAFEAAASKAEAESCLMMYKNALLKVAKWHKDGTVLAGACTGNFLLASTNILKGRDVTCHWAFTPLARKMFPEESFTTNKLLIDHGDIVSAGGATAVAQLVLYLIAREHSRELARLTAKMMLIEINFDAQSRFSIFNPNHKHSDQLVGDLQKELEANYEQRFDLKNFSSHMGLSEKQIVRRFKKVTGHTPLAYLQNVRVEHVKLKLESGQGSINQAIWEVGYEDLSSFRRLFKRMTGLTMQEYRKRFCVDGL